MATSERKSTPLGVVYTGDGWKSDGDTPVSLPTGWDSSRAPRGLSRVEPQLSTAVFDTQSQENKGLHIKKREIFHARLPRVGCVQGVHRGSCASTHVLQPAEKRQAPCQPDTDVGLDWCSAERGRGGTSPALCRPTTQPLCVYLAAKPLPIPRCHPQRGREWLCVEQ